MARPVVYPDHIEPLVRFVEDTAPERVVAAAHDKLAAGTSVRSSAGRWRASGRDRHGRGAGCSARHRPHVRWQRRVNWDTGGSGRSSTMRVKGGDSPTGSG